MGHRLCWGDTRRTSISWLDKLLAGYTLIQSNGLALPQQPTINFTTGINVANDAPNGRTNVSASGGGLSISGTGFAHVTAGSIDAAARAVALNSSDVAGQLPQTGVAPPTPISVPGNATTTATPYGLHRVTTSGGTGATILKMPASAPLSTRIFVKVLTDCSANTLIIDSNGGSIERTLEDAGIGGAFASTTTCNQAASIGETFIWANNASPTTWELVPA